MWCGKFNIAVDRDAVLTEACISFQMFLSTLLLSVKRAMLGHQVLKENRYGISFFHSSLLLLLSRDKNVASKPYVHLRDLLEGLVHQDWMAKMDYVELTGQRYCMYNCKFLYSRVPIVLAKCISGKTMLFKNWNFFTCLVEQYSIEAVQKVLTFLFIAFR